MRIIRGLMVSLCVLAVSFLAASPASAYVPNGAYNNCTGSANTGYDMLMIHGNDGHYVNGTYDTRLLRQECTRQDLNWTDGVAGYYVPVGYCVDEFTSAYVYIRTIGAGYRWWPTSVSGLKTYIVERWRCVA